MISAWDVYWVMQLDSIRGFLEWPVLFGLIFGAGLLLVSIVATDEFRDEVWPKIGKAALWIVIVCTVAGFVRTFLPSSQTAAVMIVLPAIASESVVDVVKPEARELYELAKGALKNLGAKEAEEATAAVEKKD